MKRNIQRKHFILLKYLFIILFLFSISISKNISLASTPFGGQEVRSIENLSDNKNGLIPCDPFSGNEEDKCYPKDAVTLIKKIIQVCIYIAVIALFIMLIIGGLGYVYNGKSAQYLIKWKKYIKNSVIAILIIMIVFGLTIGILSALQMDSSVLDFLKQILAKLDSPIIQKAAAQAVPTSTVGTNGEYVNFFPRQTIGSLILLVIKFLVNYIAAPALVLGAIWSGFLFVKAEGNPQKLVEAKKFAIRVVIGIVVAVSAGILVNTILKTLNEVSASTSTTTTTQEGGD